MAYGFRGGAIPADYAELVARRFSALAEPTRIRLLDALTQRGEGTVGELATAIDAGQANVSKHLGVLHAVGIVGRRKDGTKVIYRIADESVLRLCDEVCGSIHQQMRELGALLDSTGDPPRLVSRIGDSES